MKNILHNNHVHSFGRVDKKVAICMLNVSRYHLLSPEEVALLFLSLLLFVWRERLFVKGSDLAFVILASLNQIGM